MPNMLCLFVTVIGLCFAIPTVSGFLRMIDRRGPFTLSHQTTDHSRSRFCDHTSTKKLIRKSSLKIDIEDETEDGNSAQNNNNNMNSSNNSFSSNSTTAATAGAASARSSLRADFANILQHSASIDLSPHPKLATSSLSYEADDDEEQVDGGDEAFGVHRSVICLADVEDQEQAEGEATMQGNHELEEKYFSAGASGSKNRNKQYNNNDTTSNNSKNNILLEDNLHQNSEADRISQQQQHQQLQSESRSHSLSNKDDSTVISDITFDTTGAFSQITQVGNYQNYQYPSERTSDQPVSTSTTEWPRTRSDTNLVVTAAAAAAATPVSEKKPHKHKSLLKMIQSRLTPGKPVAVGGGSVDSHSQQDSYTDDVDDQRSSGKLSSKMPLFTAAKSLHFTPRVRSNSNSVTFVAPDSYPQPHVHNCCKHAFASQERSSPHCHHTSQSQQQPQLQYQQQNTQQQQYLHSMDPDVDAALAAHSQHELLESIAPESCYCVRLKIHGLSRYRVCTTDPQGEENEDNWASMVGVFSQNFFIPVASQQSLNADDQFGTLSLGRLAMTDRLVSIAAEEWKPQ